MLSPENKLNRPLGDHWEITDSNLPAHIIVQISSARVRLVNKTVQVEVPFIKADITTELIQMYTETD